MKLIVDSETDSKVVNDKGSVLFEGTREECLDYIADTIEAGLRETTKH